MLHSAPSNARRARALAISASLLALASSPARADRVITEDGRIVTPDKVVKEGDGYRLRFKHGEVVVPDASRISSVEIEGDMSDYVPQNDDERQKLEDGYVRYRGKWMSKLRYEGELKKEFEAAKERADMLALHSDFYSAWTDETKHFVIKTNTSPELLEYYGELLEAYYRLMDDKIGIKPTLSYRRKKMTVNIYKSREEFHELNAAGVGGGVAGYFWSADDTLNFYHDYAEPSLTEWVALHECTHLLTFLIDQQYAAQIWLNEAVADYLGSADIASDKRGRIEITPGKLQTDRVLTVQAAITDGKDIKLKDLFLIDRNNFHAFEYAHAWSFVYFLNNYADGEYAKDFWKFFKDLYTRTKSIDYQVVAGGGSTGTAYRASPEDIREFLLKKLGGVTVEELEKAWKEFIAAIPIESREARLKRGMRAVQRGEFKEAIEDLDAAIAGGTTDPRAWAARARAKAFSGGSKSAVDDLRKAIEMDPLNAAYRYELSMLLSGVASLGGGITIRRSGGEKPKDPEARAQAGLATELDPENDAYREWYSSFE